ncbi:MAG TPA: LAGLIDADG family homing endonuclease [Candidatus Paceibacterota bacterium]|nr:LAGLIDADG family homing endonuclease [Candidatus Paceibacterota bacterium]
MRQEWRKSAGRKGALMRMSLYGNPGTAAGRRLGGLRSLQSHAKLNTRFKTLIPIRIPRYSVRLAELLGILMGDGHVSEYQISITTNSETDRDHARFTANLIYEIFGLPARQRLRKDCKAVEILLSSKAACTFIARIGMPQGNKLKHGLVPPDWIYKSPRYKHAFLRGLIDTDGTVYRDCHIINHRSYASTCIAFTSASSELRAFVKKSWLELGYHATVSGRDVRLRRKADVLGYAKTIGFNNPKHSRKITV